MPQRPGIGWFELKRFLGKTHPVFKTAAEIAHQLEIGRNKKRVVDSKLFGDFLKRTLTVKPPFSPRGNPSPVRYFPRRGLGHKRLPLDGKMHIVFNHRFSKNSARHLGDKKFFRINVRETFLLL